ncbi:MAG TPA: hypothetical protein VF092_30575 [Longimicrobium sp.]
MRSTRLFVTHANRLLSSTGFTVVALALFVNACAITVQVGASRLLAALNPRPAWIATAAQNVVTIMILLGVSVFAALEGPKLAETARKKRKQAIRLQNPAFFSEVDTIVDRVLDARR